MQNSNQNSIPININIVSDSKTNSPSNSTTFNDGGKINTDSVNYFFVDY